MKQAGIWMMYKVGMGKSTFLSNLLQNAFWDAFFPLQLKLLSKVTPVQNLVPCCLSYKHHFVDTLQSRDILTSLA
jgi:hypothetical protein